MTDKYITDYNQFNLCKAMSYGLTLTIEPVS